MDAMKLINNLCEGYNAAADEPAMQELKPLPCPLCGSKEPKVNRGCGVVTCCEISVEDVAAWNALPRALTWTTEPPTVVGKFWWRDGRHPHEVGILTVTQTKLEGFKHRRPGPHEQFSGPIPEPKEPT